MAFKGKAGKSASGASMSKYDVEVEERLQALEKGLAECKKECASHSHGSGGGDVEALRAKLDEVIWKLTKDSILY